MVSGVIDGGASDDGLMILPGVSEVGGVADVPLWCLCTAAAAGSALPCCFQAGVQQLVSIPQRWLSHMLVVPACSAGVVGAPVP